MTNTTNPASPYNETFIAALQWMWGDGYLSPGGAAEVAEMLHGVSVADLEVVDVGCGLGAIALLLLESYGAREVLGLDVEPHLVEHAQARAARAGLSNRARFQRVEPGPLPLPDASCDVLFSKDAIVHIPDKHGFYLEALRVLRPGGLFIGSDWLRGGEETFTTKAKAWLEIVHLDLELQDLEHTRTALDEAGFENVRLTDRNEWYKGEIANEMATLCGDRFDGLVERIGREAAEHRYQSSSLKREVIESGFLRPTHFVGRRPY